MAPLAVWNRDKVPGLVAKRAENCQNQRLPTRNCLLKLEKTNWKKSNCDKSLLKVWIFKRRLERKWRKVVFIRQLKGFYSTSSLFIQPDPSALSLCSSDCPIVLLVHPTTRPTIFLSHKQMKSYDALPWHGMRNNDINMLLWFWYTRNDASRCAG